MQEWIKDAFQIGGTIGTLWAALSARKSAQISTNQLETQIEEKKQINRPRLVPLNQKVTTYIDSIFSDWQTEESDFKLNFVDWNKFSRFYIPLINTGSTHAFDVRYSFKLKGGIDSFKDYKNDSTQIKLTDPDLRQLGVNNFNFKAIEYSKDSPKRCTIQEIPVSSHIQYIPLIQSNNNSEIYLSKFFIILSNLYLTERRFNRSGINRPDVILTIRYKDQFNNEFLDQYLMILDIRHFITRGPEITTWIDFKHVQSSSIE